jgi:glycosyltransferase involved in cell wall biosynthesis
MVNKIFESRIKMSKREPAGLPEKNNGVSVIICCYNSADRLLQTLKHLANQNVPDGLSWEILLVDNASTDRTTERALEIWNQLLPGSMMLRVMQEPKPGQQFARISGAKAAKYDLLIFCDDDNWLNPDYISFSSKTMQQNELVGAAGGQNEPATEADHYPEWFEVYKDKYALGIPAARSGDVTVRGFILGAGMLTRKSLFLDMYQEKYPSLLKGRRGKPDHRRRF